MERENASGPGARRLMFELGPDRSWPIPVPPVTGRGERRHPDGKRLFTLRQAAARFDVSPWKLARYWEGVWGDALPRPPGPDRPGRPEVGTYHHAQDDDSMSPRLNPGERLVVDWPMARRYRRIVNGELYLVMLRGQIAPVERAFDPPRLMVRRLFVDDPVASKIVRLQPLNPAYPKLLTWGDNLIGFALWRPDLNPRGRADAHP